MIYHQSYEAAFLFSFGSRHSMCAILEHMSACGERETQVVICSNKKEGMNLPLLEGSCRLLYRSSFPVGHNFSSRENNTS